MKSISLKITLFLLIATVIAPMSASGADASSPYGGLYGRALKNAIAQKKPVNKVSASTAQAELFKLSGNTCQYSSGQIKNIVFDYFLLPKWIVSPIEMSGAVAADMFNIAVTDASASTLRNGLPFGEVATDEDSHGCMTGHSKDNAVVFEPTDDMKGAIARQFFYFATLYPADLWEGNGAVIFSDFSQYPTLTANAADIFLEWNRTYPPSDSELKINNRVEELQGIRNPFVDTPELAEHIWGNKKNVPFGQSSPDNPEENRYPLKSRYTTSETIWLLWPQAEDNAVWTIDGRKQEKESVKASEIGAGRHEIRFTGKTRRGRIIINVDKE